MDLQVLALLMAFMGFDGAVYHRDELNLRPPGPEEIYQATGGLE